MSLQTYAARRREEAPARQTQTSRRQGPSMDALRAGAAAPTQELLGSRVDLPGAIQAKMESAFGADLSGVQLYESQAVADAGAEAITQGNRIGFAPGKLDFVSHQGQALLGHELSHVVSQARGEVSGSGFLNDHALEARADREGAMAAAGEQVYSGPVTGSLSDVSAAPAAGPMQAKKPPKISEPELLQHNSVAQSQNDPSKYVINSEGPDAASMKGKTYGSARAAGLGLAIGGLGAGATKTPSISPEAIRGNRALQQQVLGDMNTRMASEMQKFEAPSVTNIATTFGPWRDDSVGELTTYNQVLGALTPEGTYSRIGNAASEGGLAEGYQALQDTVASSDELNDMLVGSQPAFGGSRHYDQQAQSDRLMSNYLLRVLASQVVDHQGTTESAGISKMMKDFNKRSETAKGASGYLARQWQAQGTPSAPAAPQQESLAAKRSRLRRQHFGQ